MHPPYQQQPGDPLVGTVIDGRYEILARIGEGGMGVVYKARQTSIDRMIAIKMLNAQMASDPTWVQRFYNEAKACSRLQHPNTIRMIDFGQTQDGRLYMSMEFLDGLTLRQALTQQAPMAPHRVLKILIQCCASLAEAHSIGIIHRDIKPDNVFLLNMAGSPDFVKLLDFSVAKLLQENDRMRTQAGVVFGTPQYMSPEQGRGLPLDARSDIYALGILAYEMLTGRVPFHDDNPMNVLQMHLRAELPPLPQTAPMEVQNIVRRALAKEPGQRYQSAGEMMQHCQAVFAQLQGGASIGAAGAPRTMIAGAPPTMPGPGMGGGPPPGMPPGMGPPPGMPPGPGMGGPPPAYPGYPPQGMAGGPPPGMPPGPGMGGMPPGMGAPPPYQTAGAAQKTMIAGMAPPMMGPPAGGPPPGPGMGGPPPGMPPGMGAPPPAMPYQTAGAAQKTMIAGMAPPMMGPPMGAPGPGPGMGGPPPGMPPGPGMGGPPPAMGGGVAKTMMIQPSEGIVSVAAKGPLPAVGADGAVAAGGASTAFWIISMLVGIGVGVLGYVVMLQL